MNNQQSMKDNYNSLVFTGETNIKEYQTLSDVVSTLRSEWLQQGWYSVAHGNGYIRLFKKTKTGRKNRRPSVGIEYQEYRSSEAIYEGVKAEKPWIVSGDGVSSISYKYLDKAIQRFVEYSIEVPAQ
jgi:hypothetical protein